MSRPLVAFSTRDGSPTGDAVFGGVSVEQAFDFVRGPATQNGMIAVELTVYVPLMDDRHKINGDLVGRLARTLLAIHAARNKGITDRAYQAPGHRAMARATGKQ